MKKRTLFFAISLCFVFCLAVLLSGKFLGEGGVAEENNIGDIKNVRVTLPDDFYTRLVEGQDIDLTGVKLKYKYIYDIEFGQIDWRDKTLEGNSDLKIEPENYDLSKTEYKIYPKAFPVVDFYDAAYRVETSKEQFDSSVGNNNIIHIIARIYKLYRNENNDDKCYDYCLNNDVIKVQPQTREGYEFRGYFTDKSSGTQIFDKDGERTNETWPEDKVYLYAHWAKIVKVTANNLNIEYDGKEKDIEGSVKVNGNAPTAPYFIKYSYDNGNNWTDETTTPFSNIGTYYIKYNVFKNNGGSITPFSLIKEGDITLNIYSSKKSMFMGVSSIMGFDSKLLNYNYVWFGHHEYGDGTSVDSPIKFRVLSNQTNDDYNKAGLFLLSEYTLAKEKMDSKDDLQYYSYYTSELRKKLYDLSSNDNVFKNAFNDLEKGEILKTTSIENASPDSIVNSYKDFSTMPYINKEDMFLISKVDLRNQEYFSVNSTFKNTWKIFGGIDREYFTSNKCYYEYNVDPNKVIGALNAADTVAASGDLSYKLFTDQAGVRPAMNLKVGDIAFSATTAVKDAGNNVISGAKAGAVGEEVKKVEEDTQNVFDSFKLTFFDKANLGIKLLDKNTGQQIQNPETIKINDIKSQNVIDIENIQVHDLQGDYTNKYVSAMITKKSGEIMYYGRLADASGYTGGYGKKATLKIPYTELPNNQGADTIENGDYDIKLFLEEYNGGSTDANKTDRCSDFVTIPLEVRTAIDFYQPSSTEITYNGLEQTIPSPSLQIQATYVDVQYREMRPDGTYSDDDWSFDKPFETNVKYQTPGDPTSEVLSYKMQVKVSVKDIYKNHPLLKYYNTTIKDSDLTIDPAKLEYSSRDVETYYDEQTHKLEINPYINGEDYKVQYKLQKDGEYSDEQPEFINVNDTATLSNDGSTVLSYGKTVYFKISALNYEAEEGQNTITILPINMSYAVDNTKCIYDGAPHTFNVRDYFPTADKIQYTYTYTDDNGVEHTDVPDKPNDFKVAKKHMITIKAKEIDKDKNNFVNHNYYDSTFQATVEIEKADVSVQVEGTQVEYDGEPHTINLFLSRPTVSDATVEYSTDNITWQKDKPEFTEAGEYKIYYKISSENYKETTGDKKVIITKSKVICYESQQLDVFYDGAQHAASIYVSRPTADKATVLYSNDNGATYTEKEPPRHRDVGTYKQYFKVEAGNNYEEYYGTKTLTISPRSIKRANIETISHRAYTGRPITPSVIITDGTPSIISESDYVVSYSNNVDKGEATATITGINNYTDQVTETFYITDADPTNSDNTGTSVSQTNESASGGSADLTGMAGSASSLLTGEDIRPLFVLIVTFVLNLCAALIIFKYKKREHYKGR